MENHRLVFQSSRDGRIRRHGMPMDQNSSEGGPWVPGVVLLALGVLILIRALIGSASLQWLSTGTLFIIVGALVIRRSRPVKGSGKFRWLLAFAGLIALPASLGAGMLLYPPGRGPGFSGAYAAGAVGQALVIACYLSPIPALCGYLIGRWIDTRTSRRIAP